MAQKNPIEDPDSIFLCALKEVIRSECSNISDSQSGMANLSTGEEPVPVFKYTEALEEHNKRLTLLEQKVEAIYSFISNMQKKNITTERIT